MKKAMLAIGIVGVVLFLFGSLLFFNRAMYVNDFESDMLSRESILDTWNATIDSEGVLGFYGTGGLFATEGEATLFDNDYGLAAKNWVIWGSLILGAAMTVVGFLFAFKKSK